MKNKAPAVLAAEARAEDQRGSKERLKGFWRKVRATIGLIPFSEEAVAAFYCAKDPATPPWVKAILVTALAYFIMPVDMVPDFIAGLGFTDDAAVFWAAWRAVSGHITDQHKARARAALQMPHPSGAGDQP
jgi:uncharacterized membrane protein YkvA (DUF1232 family)